ncbi:hypothetical protein C6Q35_06505 [Burkholderia multivorans]|nr:hypothetical protein C6Q35_06505 [Burkholderia multivorans]
MQLLHQLVGQRQQFRLESADHQAVRLFQLRGIDELPLFLCQRQQFDLAVDALRHRALGDKVDTGLACTAGRDFAQMPDIRDTDLVHRRGLVIEPSLVDKPRNGGLIKVKMLGDLLLSRHEYDPLWRLASREKTRVRAPACLVPCRVPGLLKK